MMKKLINGMRLATGEIHSYGALGLELGHNLSLCLKSAVALETTRAGNTLLIKKLQDENDELKSD